MARDKSLLGSSSTKWWRKDVREDDGIVREGFVWGRRGRVFREGRGTGVREGGKPNLPAFPASTIDHPIHLLVTTYSAPINDRNRHADMMGLAMSLLADR